MNDEKNAINKEKWNSRPEPSPAITDIDLNEISAGFSSDEKIDKDKRIIWVVPKGGTSSDNFSFQASIEYKYYSYINDGYKILYATAADKGHQAK